MYCSSCTKFQRTLPALGITDEVRVCELCFKSEEGSAGPELFEGVELVFKDMAPRWVNDVDASACMTCEKDFSMFKRYTQIRILSTRFDHDKLLLIKIAYYYTNGAVFTHVVASMICFG